MNNELPSFPRSSLCTSGSSIPVSWFFYSSHAPAWEFSLQRSSVAGRWSVYHRISTPERGNDKT